MELTWPPDLLTRATMLISDLICNCFAARQLSSEPLPATWPGALLLAARRHEMCRRLEGRSSGATELVELAEEGKKTL